MGLLPFGFAASGVHEAGFGVVGFDDALATGATLVLRGPLGRGTIGLPLESLLKHPLGENVLDVDEEIFDLSEFGPPRRTVGPPDLIDEIFGDAVQVRADFVDARAGLFGERHPWHLIGVGANGESGFPGAVYPIELQSCKPCTAPVHLFV